MSVCYLWRVLNVYVVGAGSNTTHRCSAAGRSIGCLDCRETGYAGREGIYELLPLSDGIKSLIDDNAEIGKLRRAGMGEGMRTLRLSGARKVAAGLTTIDEVLRVAPFSGAE